MFLSIILFITFAYADEDFSKEVEKATAIKSGIYVIEGAGGNVTASIGSNGVLLVDDDFPEMSSKLLAKLHELGGSAPKYIINTHFHYDHTGGNSFFRSATIIAAKEVRDRLSTEQTLWRKTHPPVLNGLPNLIFEDRINLFFNGEEIETVHLKNGHTDGDTIVIFHGAKIASLGDLYFSGMYPIFHPEHRGSLSQYLKNINLTLGLLSKDCIVIPGHGPISNWKELADYREMIRESIKTVQKQILNGSSLSIILKNGLDQKWERYSHGYRNTDQWLTSIFESCQKKDCL